MAKNSASRTRNFATIVYADSAPEHWRDIIESWHVPVFVSPYHDKDFNPTGEPKKPHWHVMIMFDGPKSKEQVRELFDQICGVGVEIVNSMRGMARYLCHLDNPDKYQYSTSDVDQYSSGDYFTVISLPCDKYEIIGEMMDYCVQELIFAYCDLLIYARSNQESWFRILCDSGTLVMREFLKSRKWQWDEDQRALGLGPQEKYPDLRMSINNMACRGDNVE